MLFVVAIFNLILISTIIWYARCLRPRELGVINGRFIKCPSAPNCVSSQSTDPKKWIAPLEWHGSGNPRIVLKKIILSMPGSSITEQLDGYIRAEFRSRFFRFIDDVEFYFPQGSKQIHVRSAARGRYTDFGVNRRRMEQIRLKFEAAQKEL